MDAFKQMAKNIDTKSNEMLANIEALKGKDYAQVVGILYMLVQSKTIVLGHVMDQPETMDCIGDHIDTMVKSIIRPVFKLAELSDSDCEQAVLDAEMLFNMWVEEHEKKGCM